MDTILLVASLLGGITAFATVVAGTVRFAKWMRTQQLARGGQRVDLSGPLEHELSTAAIRRELAQSRLSSGVVSVLTELLADFSPRGPEAGQFGKHQMRKEAERFLQPGESVSSKPKLYLTYWAAAVLISRETTNTIPLVSATLRKVQMSLQAAMRVGGIRVSGGPANAVGPTGTFEQVVSIRHTIAAANILFAIDPTDPHASRFLREMLDPESDMMDATGGWRLCRQVFTEVDLWSTAYAVKFLSSVSRLPHRFLSQDETEDLERVLACSLRWLSNEFVANGWSYGSVSSGENSVLIVGEIGPSCLEHDPGLARLMRELLLRCCPEGGQLSPWYLAQAPEASLSQAAIRLAYAMARLDMDLESIPDACHLEGGPNESLDELNAAELAMLVDLRLQVIGDRGHLLSATWPLSEELAGQ